MPIPLPEIRTGGRWLGAAAVLTCAGLAIVSLSIVGSGPAGAAGGADAPYARVTEMPEIVTTPATATVFLPLVARIEPEALDAWLAQYYDNRNLGGSPVYVQSEVRVDYDWGTGAPPGLPSNLFSIRWTGSWDFEAGDYTFFIYADDGFRLWWDGTLLDSSWSPGIVERSLEVPGVTAGPHQLVLEYFEDEGNAAVRLHWRRSDLSPEWKGEYFGNAWVEGSPLYSQDDPVIQFDWELGGPAGIGDPDSFSVRWTATPLFLTGTHRIYLYADEGYQLYVGGTKVKEDGWFSGQSAVDTYYDLSVSGIGHKQLTFNFHDQGTYAEARLWIEDRDQTDYTAQYYSNPDLNGSPVKTRQEEAIFYDWGLSPPLQSGIPADGFSVRWTGQRFFQAGCYRFGLFADDGVRLWVDGELLVDEWQAGRGTYYGPVTYLDSGSHQVIVEYYEDSGDAEIRFWYE